jgi:ribonucleoside-diphosphate reductase alpha chain
MPTVRIKIDLPDSWKPYRESEIRVVEVEKLDYRRDVYCCDVGVPEHSFMAEGVIISNCTEVTSEDDSDKCNLGTVWMNHCDSEEQFERVCHVATAFLLCGGLYSHVPTEEIRQVGLKNNRIGLGLGGMHEWLMQRKSPYKVTQELHKWLNAYKLESDSAAYIWANKLGVAIPKGKRAIAPTGTIGILAETTTGIEPLFCKAYKRRYLKGDKWHYQYVVDGAVKRLLAQGVELEDIQDSYDISFKERVKFQADVQNYVDMSISSTCNMPAWGSPENNEDTLKDYSKVLLKYAKRLRGFTTYPDGCRGGQPLTRVPLDEAMKDEGKVFEEHEDNCVNGVCGV